MGKIFKWKQSNFLILIFFISFAKCLLLFLCIEILLTPRQQVGYFPDSTMYERLADNLLAGNGFSLSTLSPFIPTMFKEPLYAAFLALIKLLPFGNLNFVIFTQMILNSFIAVLVYIIGKEIFNEKIARLSSFLVALTPIYGELSFLIMPENIFILLFSATILCLIKADRYMGWSWFISGGFLLGLSSLCRNAAFLMVLVYPALIFFKKRKQINAGLILKLAVLIVSFSLITAPWMVRNQKKLGLFSISRRGGEILSHQAYWAANFSSDEWKAYSLYLLSGRLAQKLYPNIIGDNLGNYEYAILMRTSYVDQLLQKYKEGEVEKILTRQAMKDIMRHPFRYLLLSGIVYVQSFKYFESIALMLIRGFEASKWIMSFLRFFLFTIGVLYTLFAFKGILYSRRIFDTSLLLVTIVYFHILFTSIGIIPGGLQRHILPITIFYSFFAVIAIGREKVI